MKINSKSQNRFNDFSRVVLMGAFGVLIFAATASAARGDRPKGPDHEKRHAAMEACAAETGVKRVRGERPSEADRAKMDTCLAAKGITRPPRPPHGEREHGRPPGPPPTAGEAPVPAEAPPAPAPAEPAL